MLKDTFMQRITPHLWYDKEAKEAAAFYTSVFPGFFRGLMPLSLECRIGRFQRQRIPGEDKD
jgi:hypothetical protein